MALLIYVHDADETTGDTGEPLGMIADVDGVFYYENWRDNNSQDEYPTWEECLGDLLEELGLQ